MARVGPQRHREKNGFILKAFNQTDVSAVHNGRQLKQGRCSAFVTWYGKANGNAHGIL